MAHYKQKQAAAAKQTASCTQPQAENTTFPEPELSGAVQEPVLSGADRDVSLPVSSLRRSHSLHEPRSKRKESSGNVEKGAQFYLEPGDDQRLVKPDTYSPRLNGGKKDDSAKHRKIKMPNKAAGLFAKLQMKLSSNKS
jgi:hypothetical protein